ncbi:MAG: TIGR03790 family protein [Acidobacteriota bacterium]
MKAPLTGLLLASAFALAATDSFAQSGANVLLVINSASAASDQIGQHYARVRAVPQDNVLRLAIDTSEEVSRELFERQIQTPIGKWFIQHSAYDRILYIVLTKGVPLRIAGTTGRSGTVASVDSELTLLYRKLLSLPVPPQGPLANPYFLADRPIGQAKPFTHEAFDIFLVTRLDAFTVPDTLALIDRGASPVRSGRIALDEKVSLKTEAGNRWLERSAELLKGQGFGERVLLDSTARVVSNEADLLGYYSWGSNDPLLRNRDLKLSFVPGALAGMYVSTDARTFKEPPADWTLGRWEDPRTYFGGAPQSLIGDLIRQGVTGVAGHVAEPYLDATIRPDVLFPAYLSGFSLVESYYLAMPYLSWQTIVVGDPLCAPFRQRTLSAQEISREIDPSTEFPPYMSGRLLQLVTRSAAVPEAARLVVRANGRLAREDRVGAIQALEQATAIDDRLSTAQLTLATLYNASGDHDKAIDRYRRVVSIEPNLAGALNDLAYALVIHHPESLKEALSLAQRAYVLAMGNPGIADTFAWTLHLSGDAAEARRIIAAAVRGDPNRAEIQLHAAIIDAAGGAFDASARELARAIALDSKLEQSADVQRLRVVLRGDAE